MDLVKLLEISNPKGLRSIINTVIEEHNQNVEDVSAVKQQIDSTVPDALADRYTKSEVNNLLDDKVTKVEGKQLSTNDFTDAHKIKLESLENYDDTELRNLIENFENYDDTELRDLINAEIASRELADVALRNSLNTKYTKSANGIPKTDLASTVQHSLEKADTALQNIPSEYITETELNAKGYANAEDVTNIATNIAKNYETISNVDTKVAATLKSAKEYTDSIVENLVGSAPDTLDTLAELATAIKNDKNIVDTLEKSIALKADKSELDNYYVKESVDALVRGKYTKPATGVPKTDLASDVQNALNSIEANVQSDWTVTDITSDAYIKNKPSYLSQFANDVGYITSYTETDPTVPSHVKNITETNITNWNNKQAKLVSGTNIKTINGETILGSGNIAIQGGGGGITQADLLNFIYPVGSIYMSLNNNNPAYFLGGTWERLYNTFLFAASENYEAGSTGGEKEHILTATEMPKHNHTYNAAPSSTKGYVLKIDDIPSHNHIVWSSNQWSNNAVGLWHDKKAYGLAGVDSSGGSRWWGSTESGDGNELIGYTGKNGSHSHGITLSPTFTTDTGNNGAHNNMPPYLAVYMWKRTS